MLKKGATLWARKTIESKIFKQSDGWFKVWFYLVTNANPLDIKNFKRGDLLLDEEELCRVCGVTNEQLTKFLEWAVKEEMLIIRRQEDGLLLKIKNYDFYQTLDSYFTHTPKIRKKQKKAVLPENYHKEIVEIFDIFKQINPTINYGNKTNRKAVVDLIKKFGFEKTKATANYAVSIQGKKFAPVITTPYQLKEKLAQLKIYYETQEKPNEIPEI